MDTGTLYYLYGETSLSCPYGSQRQDESRQVARIMIETLRVLSWDVEHVQCRESPDAGRRMVKARRYPKKVFVLVSKFELWSRRVKNCH